MADDKNKKTTNAEDIKPEDQNTDGTVCAPEFPDGCIDPAE